MGSMCQPLDLTDRWDPRVSGVIKKRKRKDGSVHWAERSCMGRLDSAQGGSARLARPTGTEIGQLTRRKAGSLFGS